MLGASACVAVSFSVLAAALTLTVGHLENMETSLYVVTFVVLIPAGLLLARLQLGRAGSAAEEPLACLNVSASAALVTLSGTALALIACSAVLTQSLPCTSDWIRGSPLVQGFHSPSMVVFETRDLFRRGPTRPDVAESSRLLARLHSTGWPVAVLLRADLLTTTLLASETGNALPIVNGNQDRLIGKARKLVRMGIARLHTPAYALTEETFLRRAPITFAGKDPPTAGDPRYGDYFIALALSDVRRQFTSRVVARGPHGLVVLELRHRTREAGSGPS